MSTGHARSLTSVHVSLFVLGLSQEIWFIRAKIPTILPVFGDKTTLDVAQFVSIFVAKDCFVRSHGVVLHIQDGKDGITECISNQRVRLPSSIGNLQSNQLPRGRKTCHTSVLQGSSNEKEFRVRYYNKNKLTIKYIDMEKARGDADTLLSLSRELERSMKETTLTDISNVEYKLGCR